VVQQIESERKFLITKPLNFTDWPVDAREIKITQMYLSLEREGAVERVRIKEDEGRVSIILCMKEHLAPGVNRETEVEISNAEWMMLQEKIDTTRGTIRKTRYVFEWHDLTYELDVFESPQLTAMLLEVELDDISDAVEIPPFLFDSLNGWREVTGDPEWTNYQIALLAV
jgi:adenylate cyclase